MGGWARGDDPAPEDKFAVWRHIAYGSSFFLTKYNWLKSLAHALTAIRVRLDTQERFVLYETKVSPSQTIRMFLVHGSHPKRVTRFSLSAICVPGGMQPRARRGKKAQNPRDQYLCHRPAQRRLWPLKMIPQGSTADVLTLSLFPIYSYLHI